MSAVTLPFSVWIMRAGPPLPSRTILSVFVVPDRERKLFRLVGSQIAFLSTETAFRDPPGVRLWEPLLLRLEARFLPAHLS